MSARSPPSPPQARRGTRKPPLDACLSLPRSQSLASKKGSARCCPHDACPFLRSGRRRRFGLRLRLLLHGSGVLPLRRDVAIDKLDHRDSRGIAVAEARLEHSGIAAVAVLVAWAQHLEQLLDHADVAHLRNRL